MAGIGNALNINVSGYQKFNATNGAFSANTVIPPADGGTGVSNNALSTITISGAFPLTATLTAATSVTFPTSGTLATTSQLIATPVTPANGGTGVANNNSSTLTISGAFATTLTVTGATNVTLPTSGTLATTAQLPSITATQYDVLVGGAANAVASVGPGSAGQVFQSGGNAANPAYSTATYPATATGTGTILRADGTNWAATTATYPSTTTINQVLYSSAANTVGGLATANSAILATNSSGVPSITTASGNWNNTSRACFGAVAGDQASVTGDGTVYTVTWAGTTIFDQGSNFSSPNFTAPVTGKYFFTAMIVLTGVTSSHTSCQFRLVTTGRTYITDQYNIGSVIGTGNTANLTFNQVVSMSANDTCSVAIFVTGSTKVVGVTGANSFFSGYLVC